jgi:hypothetical protein
MPVSNDLVPVSVLTELGRIATIWSAIEQEILLHTSAMASQATDGWPRDNLHSPFQVLRKRWFDLARTNGFNLKTLNKLSSDLSECSDTRNSFLHGKWRRTKTRGRYQCRYWKQTNKLDLYVGHYQLKTLRGFTAYLRIVLGRVRNFTR